MRRHLSAVFRGPSPIKPREAVRAAVGAGLGVVVCGLLARAAVDGGPSLTPLLVAPVGASAVMVFAIPASPLAQPRSVIGGNTLAAVVGVACGLTFREPALAAAVAVGGALMVMALLGCLHPPGGAIALGAALAGSSSQPVGFDHALIPVGLCSVLLVALAIVYGRLTGHAYPHRAPARANRHRTRDAPAAQRLGYTPADLDRALAQYGELLDVDRDDLDALFRQVEIQAHRRLHSQIFCGEIMSRDVISVALEQSAESALAYLQQRELRAAPVLDADGRLAGMARRAELLAAGDRTVAAALDPFVHTVGPETPIDALLPMLSSGSTHEAMVLDGERRLVGIITQTDLLAVLYRAHVVEAVMANAA
ncbi:HPP family protein [Phenylobacterium sp.]|uniref:HPP family protein n=1 Tax=Phenylobacterium sp. TaxID=1871053 RepID=UPI00301C1CCE